jgi:hypothetical protein
MEHPKDSIHQSANRVMESPCKAPWQYTTDTCHSYVVGVVEANFTLGGQSLGNQDMRVSHRHGVELYVPLCLLLYRHVRGRHGTSRVLHLP